MAPRALASAARHLREAARIAPGGPARWLGVRVALATGAPLALAPVLPAEAATWAPLAGFSIALLDKGGAYRSRATAMLAALAGGLAAIAAGSAAAGDAPAAAAVITAGVAACALAHGVGAAAVGNSIAVQLIVAASVPLPEAWGDALAMRLAGFAVGGVWACVLGLVLWPVRVYAPARQAVAALLEAVADQAAAIAGTDRARPGYRDALVAQHRPLRERLEAAREVLVATRRGRLAESGRGERLLAIVQATEQTIGALVALEEVVDAGCSARTLHRIAARLARDAAMARDLAARIVVEHPPRPAGDGGAVDPEPGGQEADPVARALAAQAELLLGRVRDDLRLMGDLVASLEDDRDPLRDGAPLVLEAPPLGERLRALLDPSAAVARHALRVAVGVLGLTIVAGAAGIAHASWATLTCFALLQPQRAATAVRTVQRVAGTVAGGVLAAALASAVTDPFLIWLAVVLLAGLSAAVLQLNHGLYAVFVTPTFVLLAEAHMHEEAVVGARVASTAIGGLVALAAAITLWPERERERFDASMARVLDAAAAYLDAAAGRATSGRATWSGEPSVLAERRRELGLALNDADVALDRVVAENVPHALIEPRMTLVTFARRLAAATNAFASGRAVTSYDADAAAIRLFTSATTDRLGAIAEAFRAGKPPPTRDRSSHVVGDPVVAARLDRIALQLAVLADAAARAVGADRRAGPPPRGTSASPRSAGAPRERWST